MLGEDISNDIHQLEKTQSSAALYVEKFEERVKRGMYALESRLDRAIE